MSDDLEKKPDDKPDDYELREEYDLSKLRVLPKGRFSLRRKSCQTFMLVLVFSILLLGAVYVIYQSMAYSDTFSSMTNFFNKVKRCPPTESLILSDRTIDLDSTIPLDSKRSFVISLTDNVIETIYFSTDSQVLDYLQGLNNLACFYMQIPAGCMMGHYVGEPVSRPTCTIPTSRFTPTPYTRTVAPNPPQPTAYPPPEPTFTQ